MSSSETATDRGTAGSLLLRDFTFDAAPGRNYDVTLTYRSYGTLDPATRDNAVLIPSFYTGGSADYAGWIGAGLPFDPSTWFIVCADMFGNGRAESPSTTACPDLPFDAVTIADNVRAQRALVDHLAIRELALVAGWSMGGMQAYEWAASYPGLVQAILPVCATARCGALNRVFLAGLLPFLDMAMTQGQSRSAGLAGFGRAYAGWAYSAAFYHDREYAAFGDADEMAVLDRWARDHQHWDPRDLRAMLRTWQCAGFATTAADAAARLSAITAAAIVMPCDTDMYFTHPDAAAEAALLPGGELDVIRSSWGHAAGRPGLRPEVTAQIAAAARRLLSR